MNIKRGILISLALYAANFIMGVILVLATKKILASTQNISTTYWLITITLTVLMTSLASLWYFNGKNVARNIVEGLKLGIIFVSSSFIVDMLFLILTIITTGKFEGMFDYYKSSAFYLIRIIVLGTTIFIGSRNQAHKTIETKNENKSKKNKK